MASSRKPPSAESAVRAFLRAHDLRGKRVAVNRAAQAHYLLMLALEPPIRRLELRDLVLELMVSQGGDLWVTDSAKGGASFRLRLPAISVLRQGDHEVAQLGQAADDQGTVATPVVDDDVTDTVRRTGQLDG